MGSGKIVITGCPRSGTRFASRLFQLNGVDVGHELLGSAGISSWVLVGRGSTSPCGAHWDSVVRKYGDVDVHHQVRRPLDVIASLFTIGEASWAYAFGVLGRWRSGNMLYDAMVFWYEWNLRAADMSVATYRVDDACSYFGLARDLTDTRVNSRPHDVVTAEACRRCDASLYSDIELLASGYGFDI